MNEQQAFKIASAIYDLTNAGGSQGYLVNALLAAFPDAPAAPMAGGGSAGSNGSGAVWVEPPSTPPAGTGGVSHGAWTSTAAPVVGDKGEGFPPPSPGRYRISGSRFLPNDVVTVDRGEKGVGLCVHANEGLGSWHWVDDATSTTWEGTRWERLPDKATAMFAGGIPVYHDPALDAPGMPPMYPVIKPSPAPCAPPEWAITKARSILYSMGRRDDGHDVQRDDLARLLVKTRDDALWDAARIADKQGWEEAASLILALRGKPPRKP